MSRQVKICGITALADIQTASEAGADYVGFNFCQASPRYLVQEQAAQLASASPENLLRVAVVQDATDDDIDAAIAATNPHFLQLHGQETPARSAEIKTRIMPQLIKVIGLASAQDTAKAEAYTQAADMLLFDNATGGSGKQFDWSWLANYRPPLAWGLAGGLTAENIADAIAKTGATMLDVSSGVEAERGKKSPEKIRAFVRAAKG